MDSERNENQRRDCATPRQAGTWRVAVSPSLGFFLIALCATQSAAADNLEKEIGSNLKTQYKGTQVSVMVTGFYAGEFKKDNLARMRQDFVNWHHYHESVTAQDKRSIRDQIDSRTVAMGPGAVVDAGLGSNTFPVAKGEPLAVSNVFFGCARGICSLILYLDTMKLSTAAALDPRRESRGEVFESAGLGCEFFFHFSRDFISRAGAEDAIVATVRKYLVPVDEAAQLLRKEKDIRIEIGESEERVRAKLGEPLRTVSVGTEKSLKYADLTVMLRDGKVVEVKLQ